ncbi:MAG: lysylphosphatidylglycerol synthase transmembrane domain-containing protein [Pirellulaceae bacterium]
MASKRVKYSLAIIKVLISATILWYLFSNAQSEGQIEALQTGQKQWTWFLVAIVLCFAFHAVGLVRWYLVAHAMELPLKLKDAIRIGFVGQFFGLVAFGVVGGDAIRAYYACDGKKRQIGKAVASVFFDRAIGLLAMMFFAGAGYFLTDWAGLSSSESPKMVAGLKTASLLLLVVSTLGFATVGIAMVVSERLLMRGYELAVRVPFVGGLLGNFVKAVRSLRGKRSVVVLSVILSFVVNLLIIANIFSVAKFVGGNHPGLLDHCLISPLAMIANSLPLPGGIGGMEAVLAFQYQALTQSVEGGDSGEVVGFIFRFVLLLISAVGGIVWLTMNAHDRSVIQQAQDSDSK